LDEAAHLFFFNRIARKVFFAKVQVFLIFHLKFIWVMVIIGRRIANLALWVSFDLFKFLL